MATVAILGVGVVFGLGYGARLNGIRRQVLEFIENDCSELELPSRWSSHPAWLVFWFLAIVGSQFMSSLEVRESAPCGGPGGNGCDNIAGIGYACAAIALAVFALFLARCIKYHAMALAARVCQRSAGVGRPLLDGRSGNQSQYGADGDYTSTGALRTGSTAAAAGLGSVPRPGDAQQSGEDQARTLRVRRDGVQQVLNFIDQVWYSRRICVVILAWGLGLGFLALGVYSALRHSPNVNVSADYKVNKEFVTPLFMLFGASLIGLYVHIAGLYHPVRAALGRALRELDEARLLASVRLAESASRADIEESQQVDEEPVNWLSTARLVVTWPIVALKRMIERNLVESSVAGVSVTGQQILAHAPRVVGISAGADSSAVAFAEYLFLLLFCIALAALLRIQP